MTYRNPVAARLANLLDGTVDTETVALMAACDDSTLEETATMYFYQFCMNEE